MPSAASCSLSQGQLCAGLARDSLRRWRRSAGGRDHAGQPRDHGRAAGSGSDPGERRRSRLAATDDLAHGPRRRSAACPVAEQMPELLGLLRRLATRPSLRPHLTDNIGYGTCDDLRLRTIQGGFPRPWPGCRAGLHRLADLWNDPSAFAYNRWFIPRVPPVPAPPAVPRWLHHRGADLPRPPRHQHALLAPDNAGRVTSAAELFVEPIPHAG